MDCSIGPQGPQGDKGTYRDDLLTQAAYGTANQVLSKVGDIWFNTCAGEPFISTMVRG